MAKSAAPANPPAQPPATRTFRDLLMQPAYQASLRGALPKHLTAERLSRVVLTAINRNRGLLECTPESLWEATMICASLGLEPDALGRAYIIPYTNNRKGADGRWEKVKQAQFQVGYKGLAELAYRSGQVATVKAGVVREGDDFSYEYGLNEHLTHRPLAAPDAPITHAYAYCKLKDGGFLFEVMTHADIIRIRDTKSQGYQQALRNAAEYSKPVDSPWENDFPEMAKKTAFKRLSKWLPLSPEFRDAIAHDDEADIKDADVILPEAPKAIVSGEDMSLPPTEAPPPAVPPKDEPTAPDAGVQAAHKRAAAATSQEEADAVLARFKDQPPKAAIAAMDDLAGLGG